MEVMKNNEERMKKQVRESISENKKLISDLKSAEEQVVELSRQLTNYEKDKLCLSVIIKFIYSLNFYSHR